MSQELMEIAVMLVVTLSFLLGIFFLVYVSDKKAEEEKKKLS